MALEGLTGWLGKLVSTQETAQAAPADSPESNADLSVGLPAADHAFWTRSDARDKVIEAVQKWEASRAETEAALKKAMSEQVGQLKAATAAIEAKRVLQKELAETKDRLTAERKRANEAEVLCTRVQRETSAKLADARAAGDDFRKGPTAEVARLRERVAQLEAQLAAKSAAASASQGQSDWDKAEAATQDFHEKETLQQDLQEARALLLSAHEALAAEEDVARVLRAELEAEKEAGGHLRAQVAREQEAAGLLRAEVARSKEAQAALAAALRRARAAAAAKAAPAGAPAEGLVGEEEEAAAAEAAAAGGLGDLPSEEGDIVAAHRGAVEEDVRKKVEAEFRERLDWVQAEAAARESQAVLQAKRDVAIMAEQEMSRLRGEVQRLGSRAAELEARLGATGAPGEAGEGARDKDEAAMTPEELVESLRQDIVRLSDKKLRLTDELAAAHAQIVTLRSDLDESQRRERKMRGRLDAVSRGDAHLGGGSPRTPASATAAAAAAAGAAGSPAGAAGPSPFGRAEPDMGVDTDAFHGSARRAAAEEEEAREDAEALGGFVASSAMEALTGVLRWAGIGGEQQQPQQAAAAAAPAPAQQKTSAQQKPEEARAEGGAGSAAAAPSHAVPAAAAAAAGAAPRTPVRLSPADMASAWAEAEAEIAILEQKEGGGAGVDAPAAPVAAENVGGPSQPEAQQDAAAADAEEDEGDAAAGAAPAAADGGSLKAAKALAAKTRKAPARRVK